MTETPMFRHGIMALRCSPTLFKEKCYNWPDCYITYAKAEDIPFKSILTAVVNSSNSSLTADFPRRTGFGGK